MANTSDGDNSNRPRSDMAWLLECELRQWRKMGYTTKHKIRSLSVRLEGKRSPEVIKKLQERLSDPS